MKIEIKSLHLVNFKGIPDLTINFKHLTSIYGENASGKTTVFDAFTWLLFGKDSGDRKDFGLKPYDADGRAKQKLEVEVSADLLVDGKTIELKRIFREKWVTRKGEATPEFAGNETLYFYNDVPCKQSEYQAKIASLLEENAFKLLTNPLYFNTLKWEDRRALLMKIAGDIQNAEIALGNSEFEALMKKLGDKSLNEYKKEIASKKRKIKDQLDEIPTRIAEVKRLVPDTDIDYSGKAEEVSRLQDELQTVEAGMTERTEYYQQQSEAIRQKQQALHNLKLERDNIRNGIEVTYRRQVTEATAGIKQFEYTLEKLRKELARLTQDKTPMEERATQFKKRADDIRARWHTENQKEITFDDHAFSCPTCNRALDPEVIATRKEQMIASFNTDKQNRLSTIKSEGQQTAAQAKAAEDDAKSVAAKIAILQKDILSTEQELKDQKDSQQLPKQSLDELIESDSAYQAICKKIAAAQSDSKELEPFNIDDLKTRKQDLRRQIEALQDELSKRGTIEKAKARIEELEAEQKVLAQQVADYEGTEFSIDRFVKAKIDAMEERINGKFEMVRFKMFNHLINGGVEETCETTVNGVPWSDLNTAARINAGIDIINVLSQHFQVSAPIFIDNRESVNRVIPCESQLVNLIVSSDKQLRVA